MKKIVAVISSDYGFLFDTDNQLVVQQFMNKIRNSEYRLVTEEKVKGKELTLIPIKCKKSFFNNSWSFIF